MPREKWYTVPPSVFGTNFARASISQPYVGHPIQSMAGMPTVEGVIIGAINGNAAGEGMKRIAADGTETWNFDWNTTSNQVLGYDAIKVVGDHVYATGRNRRCGKFLASDGSTVWLQADLRLDAGGTSIAVATDESRVFAATSADSDTHYIFDGSTGAFIGSKFPAANFRRVWSAAMSATDDVVAFFYNNGTASDYPVTAFTASTFASGATPLWSTDMRAAPTTPATTGSVEDHLVADLVGGFWATSRADAYLWHLDSSGTVDIEINLAAASTVTGTVEVAGLAVDRYGDVYACMIGTGAVDTTNYTDRTDVLRYSSAGVLVSSSGAQNILIYDRSVETNADAESMSIDGLGNVYIGSDTGHLCVLSQS